MRGHSDLSLKRIAGVLAIAAFTVFSSAFIMRSYFIETLISMPITTVNYLSKTEEPELTPTPKRTYSANDIIQPYSLSVKKQPRQSIYDNIGDKPRVLLYHTHTFEAYEQEYEGQYKLAHGAKWRTENSDYNIIAVGKELKEALEVFGVEVVHDTTAFEPPRLGTAYMRSLDMLEKRLENGEEYDLIIDMHRDAYNQRSWDPKSIIIDGEECARLMLLMGTGEAGFDEKPKWEENCLIAQSIIDELRHINEGLSKNLNLKDQRYNQHVSTKCVLIEVGHNENTITQAKASMKYLAIAIYRVLQE